MKQAQTAMHSKGINAACPQMAFQDTIPQDSNKSCGFLSWSLGIYNCGRVLHQCLFPQNRKKSMHLLQTLRTLPATKTESQLTGILKFNEIVSEAPFQIDFLCSVKNWRFKKKRVLCSLCQPLLWTNEIEVYIGLSRVTWLLSAQQLKNKYVCSKMEN